MAMYSLHLDDGALFGNDAGEDEPIEILASYFVGQQAFGPFLDDRRKYAVARSNKGMGKSALLSKLAFDLESKYPDAIIVKVIGSQITSGSIPQFNSFLDAQAFWIRSICSKINMALGANIGFAFSDTSMALVEAAEVSGLKSRNIVGALLSRIKSSKIPIEVSSPVGGDPSNLLDRAMDKYGDQQVWLLVDDIDASFENVYQQRLAVGSFFSACRHISTNFKGVNIRCTVRSDVWTNLRAVEDLDKSEQYIIDISWSKNELRSILSKKIWAWIERSDPYSDLLNLDYIKDAEQIIELAFDRRIRWGWHKVPPFQAISILAAGRPRWMSQLCRIAGGKAAIRGRARISSIEINASMPEFTTYRLRDLYKEHGHQFSQMERLVSVFTGSKTIFSTDDLCSKINKEFVGPVGVNNVSTIDGESYSNPLQLAALLFRVGFLVGRVGNEAHAGSADFITYNERPELLRYGMPSMEDLTWEIYPSYRSRPKQKNKNIGA